uniref:UV-stimulated scaffold protein A n=1 Tax=Plectus sambesii TaxID=2011161 RepID=A0A914VFS4_9BILA
MSHFSDPSLISPEGQVKRYVRSLVERFNCELKELDEKRIKQLKNLVKSDQNLIEPLIASLFEALQRPDSDRRLAALLICDQFFVRSHKFRETLIADFQDFLLYTAETDALRNPLPSPKAAAKLLKTEAIKIVRQWHDKFGPAYKKLELAYGYLKQCKTLDFERLDAETLVERQRAQEATERKERVQQKVAQKIASDFEGHRADIEQRLTEAKNAINLLFPEFCPTDQLQLSDRSDSTRQESLQLHGIASTDHHVTVEVNLSEPAVKTTDDNAPLVEAVADSKKLLEKDLRRLSKWLQQLAKVGGRSSEQLSKRLIDLKNDCATELARCQDLNLPVRQQRERRTARNGSDSEDSDFEDVPEKEGLELDFKLPADDRVPQHILDHLQYDVDDSDRPGPSGINTSKSTAALSQTPTEQEGHSDIPTLAFGLDLKYWGQDKVEVAAMPKNNADCHRFWRAPDESDATDGSADIYRTRVISFGGKFKPVERECRHPLADGAVCTRKDRVKCPFHGIIIERDTQGNPTMRHEGRDRMGQSASTSQDKRQSAATLSSNREETDYLRDLERSTGAALGGAKSSTTASAQRHKKRQLTEAQMARNRLQTRLFNKSALKRVGDTLDAIQDARNKKKFGQQFSYSISKRRT